MKKMALGMVLNSVLPVSLGSLRKGLGASEAKLQQDMQQDGAKRLAGVEVDDTVIQNMTRISPVSSFFQDDKRKVHVV